MTVIGNPRIAEGAEEDGVDVVAEVEEAGFGERFTGRDIVIGGPGEGLEPEVGTLTLSGGGDDGKCGLDDLGPDAVAWDNGDSEIRLVRDRLVPHCGVGGNCKQGVQRKGRKTGRSRMWSHS